MQGNLFAAYGNDTIFIGAGSSLTVLDPVCEGKELTMRDLDIFVFLEGEMTEAKARHMEGLLESREFGRCSAHAVRPRRRRSI